MRDEKRKYPRFPIRLRVQYGDSDRTMLVSSKDVSQGGVYLSTAKPAEPGTAVSLMIELPDDWGTVWATGNVIHFLAGRGMGISFEQFGPGSDERLKRFLGTLLL
jgi:hypothetical protein